MNRRNFISGAMVSLVSLILTACGKPGGVNTNPTGGTLNYKTISKAALDTLNSLLTSFQQLAASGQSQYQAAATALTRILAIATPIVNTLQTTTFPAANSQQLVDQIENLLRVTSALLTPAVLPAGVSIAINLGIGIFQTLEPLILGNTPPPGAAADISQPSASQKLAQLKVHDQNFRKMAGR